MTKLENYELLELDSFQIKILDNKFNFQKVITTIKFIQICRGLEL